MVFSLGDPEVSIVKETPCADDSIVAGSPEPKCENSSSTIIESSSGFADQLKFHSASLPNYSKGFSTTQCSIVLTPEKDATMNFHSLIPEIESSLNSSVNSHSQKRRKSICCGENKSKSDFPELLTMSHCNLSSGPVMDKRLQIYCSLCKNSLGLPENHQYVMCSLTSLSKVHLESLHKNLLKPETVSASVGIPVLLTDISSVHQQLCNRTLEGDSGPGIWCEKDGCVFNTIFCPFCSIHNNCLGVQVMATNASNIHLLNKVSCVSILTSFLKGLL